MAVGAVYFTSLFYFTNNLYRLFSDEIFRRILPDDYRSVSTLGCVCNFSEGVAISSPIRNRCFHCAAITSAAAAGSLLHI